MNQKFYKEFSCHTTFPTLKLPHDLHEKKKKYTPLYTILKPTLYKIIWHGKG